MKKYERFGEQRIHKIYVHGGDVEDAGRDESGLGEACGGAL